MTELIRELDAALARHAERPACADGHVELTYGQLDEASAALAAALPSRLGPAGAHRPRVLIQAPNSVGYLAAYLGVLRAGGVPFLLDPALTPVETAAIVDRCGIDAVLSPAAVTDDSALPVPGGRYGVTATGVDAGPDLLPGTEVCRFTSGSTGVPGCLEFAGSAVLAAARAWTEAASIGPDDRLLIFAGLFNGLSFNTSLQPGLLAGALLVLPSGPPTASQLARWAARCRPTVLTAFPAIYQSLERRELDAPELADVRVALSSAAPLRVATAETVRSRYGLSVCDYYGIAQTGPLTYDPAPVPGHGSGFPLPGVELRVGTGPNEGELEVRSSSMAAGYLGEPDRLAAALTADGFYRTGDRGRIEDGRLFLEGRSETVLNIGGRKVDPVEVETVLRDGGGGDVAVFTVARYDGDPVVVAAVSPGVDLAELRRHCRDRLAAFKIPERFLAVPQIPRTGLGKTRVEALRALYAESVAAPSERTETLPHVSRRTDD
jgi:long-chain acyl-CoA synthetase